MKTLLIIASLERNLVALKMTNKSYDYHYNLTPYSHSTLIPSNILPTLTITVTSPSPPPHYHCYSTLSPFHPHHHSFLSPFWPPLIPLHLHPSFPTLIIKFTLLSSLLDLHWPVPPSLNSHCHSNSTPLPPTSPSLSLYSHLLPPSLFLLFYPAHPYYHFTLTSAPPSLLLHPQPPHPHPHFYCHPSPSTPPRPHPAITHPPISSFSLSVCNKLT